MVIRALLLVVLGLTPVAALASRKLGYLGTLIGGILITYLGVQIHSANPLYLLYVSAGLVWVFSSVYSLRHQGDERWLGPLFGLSVFGMALAFTANSTLEFLAGYEVMTVPAYASMGVHRRTDQHAFVFMSFGELSNILVLAGFIYSYVLTGSFGFSSLGSPFPFILVSFGFMVKMGLLPFMVSEWLPIAHGSTPSNMSAILSASMTLVAFYGLLKVALLSPDAEDFGLLLTAIGGFSVFFGSLYAYTSEQPKSLLGFSTIENNGAMLACAGVYVSAPTGTLALFALITAGVYALGHSISKTGLFLLTDSMNHESLTIQNGGKTKLNQAGGIMLASSMSGLLPTIGGVATWALLEALFMEAFIFHSSLAAVPIVVGSMIAMGEGFATAAMLKLILFTHVFNPRKSEYRRADLVILATGVSAVVAGSMTYFAYAPFVSGGNLGVAAGLIVSRFSEAPFGGISPLYVLLIPPVVATGLISLIGKPRIRRAEAWNTGLQPEVAYDSLMYSNNIRLMLRKILMTRVSDGGVQTTDFFWRSICVFASGFLRFSKRFSRTYMNSSLSWYVAYMIVAFVVVVMVIAK
jgi:formate hydrogenlyase subunit 3/multisubunit Na+/H+ antiporter MnhD subunit